MKFSDLSKKKSPFTTPPAQEPQQALAPQKVPPKDEPVAKEAPRKEVPLKEEYRRTVPAENVQTPEEKTEAKFQAFMADEQPLSVDAPPAQEEQPEPGRQNSAPHCLKPDLGLQPKKTLWSRIPSLRGPDKSSERQAFEMPKIVLPESVPAMGDAPDYAAYLRQLQEHAYNLYEYSVLSVRYALLSLICEDRTAYGPVAAAAENITTMLDSGDQSLVALAGKHYMPDNTSRHSVNVAIYSVFLCELLNMKKEERMFVASAALLHDLGTQKYERIINKPDKFTLAEREMIQRHPMDAKDIIENLEGLGKNTAQTLAKVVMEVYEKYDGTGYPYKKQGEAISQHAQIIGIANVYEALTHARSWRKELHQHDALKMMLDHAGSSFSKKIVRLLIDGLSMYPPGSLVLLSTGDLARVIEINPKLISQPKVELLKNSRTSANRFLNLATEKGILITGVAHQSDKTEF